ncbi:MAG TPA: helix-turn-helix domain-containing protein [Acidimicrobiales bacterium]|nr:helix-turn-helix domain-containing protein [Acidimicrobiales bacterium]
MPGDLPTSAAAKILGVHPDTLARWADEGKVPYWRTPGGQRRFRREDIEALSMPTSKAAGE